MRLEGKVAVISGGARGMGAEEARLFVAEGAKVVIGDILDDAGKMLEAEIAELGGECLFIHLDVTSESDWSKIVEAAVNAYGKVDILVNNAGIFNRAKVEEETSEDWDRVLDINSKGTFLGIKSVIPVMRQVGGGSIVNISSIAGLTGSLYGSSYHASKGAVRLLTKSAALQYAGDGIRCNSVHPGLIETTMAKEVLPDSGDLEERRRIHPMRRLGRAEEVAKGVLFLASDESSYMTGSELVIDGGATAQ